MNSNSHCNRKEEFKVPEQFCCRCLLPLWTLHDDVQLHDAACGSLCKHVLADYGKMLFAIAKERTLPQLALFTSGADQGINWDWMFTSRIPGILQLFGGLRRD
jgi:hypothetical protein